MISKIFVKSVLFIVSWIISGMALFIALFSTCASGKVHERVVEGAFIFFRFIASTGRVFMESRDIKIMTIAISSTLSELVNVSVQNIEADYKQVLISSLVAYFSIKILAGVLSMLRRKIKIGLGKRKLPPVSKKPIRDDEPRENIDPADRTVLTSGGY